MNDFDIEQQLAAAMESRTRRVHAGPGSVRDVRTRARRRARRRAVGGAGAIVAVGALGAVALATRPEPSSRFADGAGEGADAGGLSDGVGYWRCTGPLAPPSGDASIASTTTIITTSPGQLVPADGAALFQYCEPVGGAVSATTTVALETAPSVERPVDETTTIVWPPDASVTTVEVPPTTIAPGYALDETTTSIIGDETATTVREMSDGCLTSSGISLSLDPSCWLSIDEAARPLFFSDVEKDATRFGYDVYTIVDGDYVAKIAEQHGLSVDFLVAANGGDPDMVVVPGMPLLIPPLR